MSDRPQDSAPRLIRIREAAAIDLPELLRLYRQLLPADTPDMSLADAERIFLRIGNYPDYRIYLAEQNGLAVATYALLIMDSLGHQGVPAAILEDVVVHEDLRGLGIGRLMMAHATAQARRQGCAKLFLSSGRHRVAAHDFYRSLGFREHGASFSLSLPEPGRLDDQDAPTADTESLKSD